jgi:hypothetical protein
VIYDLLFKASAETTLEIAATPRHLGARIGFMSVLHRFFGDHMRLADKAAFAAYLRPLRKIDWVVYAKQLFAGPQEVLRYLSRTTHRIAISNRRLVSADEKGVTFKYKDYRIEGPGRYKTMTLNRRVHPALADPCAAEGLPPHPALWAARQRQPSRKHCARSPTARDAAETARHRQGRRAARAVRAGASMPVLWRPHAHHRDLCARLRAAASAFSGAARAPDRYVMIEIALSPATQRRPFTTSLPLTIGQRRWRSFDDALPTSCNSSHRTKTPTKPHRASSPLPPGPSKHTAFTRPTPRCQTVERLNSP